MPIRLWVSWREEEIFDTEVRAESFEQSAFKLRAIIQYRNPRYVETCDNVFLEKSFSIDVPNIGKWFGPYPFCEVVRCYYKKTFCFQEPEGGAPLYPILIG